jgi:hypothetical protein
MNEMEKWVDVDECKPGNGIFVLISILACGHQHPERVTIGYHDVRGDTWWDMVEDDPVYPSHWMPLPRPHK